MIRVSGASGFIGNAVLQYCLANQIAVTGYSRSQSKSENIVQCDDYATIPAEGTLIHLAETRTIGELTPDDAEAQLCLSQQLSRAGFRHIVYASSAAVYAPSIQRIDATTGPFSTHRYGESKMQNEAVFAAAGATIARISNVYGPDMATNTAIGAVLQQCHESHINVFNLSAVRDYIWVEDVAAALVNMALHPKPGTYHVSTGAGTSVRELISLATAAVGNRNYSVGESSPQIASGVVLNPQNTQICYDWHHSVSISEGIRRLVRK